MYNSKAFKNVPYIIRFAERVFELGTEYRGHSNIYIYEYELILSLW